ncbi:unnamed protein product [Ectocarpus fasciculatus]
MVFGRRAEYFIFDWSKANEASRGKATRVVAKNHKEATRLQVERWIAQGALRDSLDEGSPRHSKSVETTPSKNMGSQVEPAEPQRSSDEAVESVEETELKCSWEKELRPPMEDPLLGEVAKAISSSDIWASVPSLDSFAEPSFLDNRTNRRLSNVMSRVRKMSISDQNLDA